MLDKEQHIRFFGASLLRLSVNMLDAEHKRTTLTTGGKRDRQKPTPNRKPRFVLQNLPKPTNGKIFETVTTLIATWVTGWFVGV